MTRTIIEPIYNLKETIALYDLKEALTNKRKELGLSVRELGKKIRG